MGRRKINLEAPIQPLKTAARITGLSVGYLRAGCQAGTIRCVRVGTEYRVVMPELLRTLGLTDRDQTGLDHE